ncbi:MAG: hypothetical protein V8S08_10595 [Lachnoclostridium sp.]
MKEFIMQYSQEVVQELTVERIVLNMVVALVLGLVIYLSYRFSHSGAVYSARFNVSLLMMTLITTMIMNVIGNNIALSLGMVGALSIVRFRTAIKDTPGYGLYFLVHCGGHLLRRFLLCPGGHQHRHDFPGHAGDGKHQVQ